ncbi:MAG: hypothetical protein KDI73_13170, partial [Candidatus Competibacteraceae bacterium]|nr:hypothetical protein [Candidatus Competibacteraceae bacterium]
MVERFYATGDLGPLCDLLERTYFKVFDNRDLRWSNELVVKTAFLVVLFNDAFYVMDSEPALERGYGDLMLRVRPHMRQYQLLDHLLEFKTRQFWIRMGRWPPVWNLLRFLVTTPT